MPHEQIEDSYGGAGEHGVVDPQVKPLDRIKQRLAHVEARESARYHCNGVDAAYFRVDDVKAVIAEVERLKKERSIYGLALEKIVTPRPSRECHMYYAEAENLQRIARESLAEAVRP